VTCRCRSWPFAGGIKAAVRTSVTDAGLRETAGLKHLQALILVGTPAGVPTPTQLSWQPLLDAVPNLEDNLVHENSFVLKTVS